MGLNAIGAYGLLARAQIGHLVEADVAIASRAADSETALRWFVLVVALLPDPAAVLLLLAAASGRYAWPWPADRRAMAAQRTRRGQHLVFGAIGVANTGLLLRAISLLKMDFRNVAPFRIADFRHCRSQLRRSRGLGGLPRARHSQRTCSARRIGRPPSCRKVRTACRHFWPARRRTRACRLSGSLIGIVRFCAGAASGQAAALPRPAMNSRRLIRSPRRRGRGTFPG
jgi:hypothetical protein